MGLRKYTYYLSSVVKLLTGVRPLTTVVRVFLHLAPPGVQFVELPQAGVKFKVRGVMDIWSVKETFLDRFYEKYGTPIQDGWKVLDIGGGIGDFTVFASLQCPSGSVYAFEPTPQSFALLQENLRLNRVGNVKGFPEAIWSENGTLAIDTTIGEPGQFISHKVEGGSPHNGKVMVSSISLAEVFNRLALDRVDLLKMDCEGAEYPVLFKSSQEVLGRIQRMVMEYHDNVTEYTHTDLESFLVRRGFQVQSFVNPVHNYLGYLYACRNV
jgi:FkbM family methyltransferase